MGEGEREIEEKEKTHWTEKRKQKQLTFDNFEGVITCLQGQKNKEEQLSQISLSEGGKEKEGEKECGTFNCKIMMMMKDFLLRKKATHTKFKAVVFSGKLSIISWVERKLTFLSR